MICDVDYAAYRDGNCVAIASKIGGESYRSEWIRAGYEVREMPVSDACEAHLIYLKTLPSFQGMFAPPTPLPL